MDGVETLTQVVQQLTTSIKELYRKQIESEKVVLFMDNSNLYGSIARLSRESGYKYRIDYHRLLNMLVGNRFCINAICYYPEWELDFEQHQKRDGFQSIIQKAGYQISRVPQRNNSGREKGLDTAIIRDMTTIAHNCPRVDTFILVAGDGDYSDTVRELRFRHGLKVEVAFFSPETAFTLKEAAYKFTDLESIATQLQLDVIRSDS